jgi:ankyrin repeat protein
MQTLDSRLFKEVKKGNLRKIEQLLAEGASPKATDTHEMTAFHWAARMGTSEVMAQLLQHGDPTCFDDDGAHPIHTAIEHADLETVERLLEHGVNIDVKVRPSRPGRGFEGFTPLHLAVFLGHDEMVDLLAARGANLNEESAEQTAPIHTAANKGQMAVLQKLIELGVDPQVKASWDDMTPFDFAFMGRKLEIAEYLVKKTQSREDDLSKLRLLITWKGLLASVEKSLDLGGARGAEELRKLLAKMPDDLAQKALAESTALEKAAERGDLELVKAVCELADSPFRANPQYRFQTPIDVAKDPEVREFLLMHGPPPSAEILDAIKAGDRGKVEELLERGVSPDYDHIPGGEILMIALEEDQYDIARLLMAKSERLEQIGGAITPAMKAIYGGEYDLAKDLLEADTKVNESTVRAAMDHRRPDLVALMLDKHPDILEDSLDKRNLFDKAIKFDDLELVKILAERSDPGVRPMEAAIKQGKIDILRYLNEKAGGYFGGCTWLLREAAELEDKAIYNLLEGPLTVIESVEAAVGEGDLDALTKLVDDGLDINVELAEGKLLYYACSEKASFEIISFLLERGADVNVSASGNRTPLKSFLASAPPLDQLQVFLEHGLRFEPGREYLPELIYADADDDTLLQIIDFLLDAGLPHEQPEGVASACGQRSLEFVMALIERGLAYDLDDVMAKVEWREDRSEQKAFKSYFRAKATPIINAVGRRDMGALEAASNEKSANAKDKSSGRTALHFAAEQGFLEGAEHLLALGAKPKTKDKSKRAPIHAAAAAGQNKIVELLLDKGATAKDKDGDGMMPLHHAVESGSVHTVKLLVERGAKPTAGAEPTPLELARQLGDQAMLDCLGG